MSLIATMTITDLKQGYGEQTLESTILLPEQKEKIRQELRNYDEYYLASSGHAVKVFQQEFVRDPHMNLPRFPRVRLIHYDPGTDLVDLEEIFQKDTVPIITRVRHGAMLPSFQHIPTMEGQDKSILRSVQVPLPALALTFSEIRVMESTDLEHLESLFRNEYSLRYRFVPLMYNDTACFVYEQQETIMGASFNAIEGDQLYMRQIFVREAQRGKGIGQALYVQRLAFARQHGLSVATAHIRNESLAFHAKFNAKLSKLLEYYIIRK